MADGLLVHISTAVIALLRSTPNTFTLIVHVHRVHHYLVLLREMKGIKHFQLLSLGH